MVGTASGSPVRVNTAGTQASAIATIAGASKGWGSSGRIHPPTSASPAGGWSGADRSPIAQRAS